jgi:hypothetical protein
MEVLTVPLNALSGTALIYWNCTQRRAYALKSCSVRYMSI